jgi:4'-phosphopantetheinyl transferase
VTKIWIIEQLAQKQRNTTPRKFYGDRDMLYEYFISTAENGRKNLLYQLWVLKESYVKATGKGLHTSLNTIQVIGKGKIIAKRQEPDSLFLLKQYNIDSDYATALCAKNPAFELPKTVEILTIEALIKDFFALL